MRTITRYGKMKEARPRIEKAKRAPTHKCRGKKGQSYRECLIKEA